MDRTNDGQTAPHQFAFRLALGHHVPGNLVFKTVHALVEIAARPGPDFGILLRSQLIAWDRFDRTSLGPGTHQQPGFTLHGVPTERLLDRTMLEGIGAGIRRKIILPQTLQCRDRLLLGDHTIQADLMHPGLSQDLIDVAPRTGLQSPALGIGLVDEVLPIEQFRNHVLLAPVDEGTTLTGKGSIAHFIGHRLAGSQGTQIQSTDPAHWPVPGRVQRVRLGAFNQSVAVGILGNQELYCLLDVGPEPTQEGVIP